MTLKLVKNIVIDDISYYGTSNWGNGNGLSQKTLIRKMERFMTSNPIIETDDMYIDVKNVLNRRFGCCKENCDLLILKRNAQKKGLFSMGGDTQDDHIFDKACCEGGSYPIPDSLIENINEHLDEIIEVLPKENQEIIKDKGYLKGKKGKQSIRTRKSDDMCIMGYESNGMIYCALHAYALKKNENILDYKPYDCSIFPMDFIRINGKILLTTISDNGETAEILRWGDVHMSQRCLHQSMKGDPLYLYSKATIENVVGEENWKLIDEIYKSGSWKEFC